MPEEQEEEEEEEQITVDTPQVTCDLGRDIQLVKLPTFMKIEPKYCREDPLIRVIRSTLPYFQAL